MLEQSAERVFASIMGAYQISARITDNVTYCGEWIEREPQMDRGIFHLISSGSCRVEASYLPAPLTLGSGDLIVFPRGGPHTLCQVMRTGAEQPADTAMLCGEFTSQGGKRNAVLDSLPEFFVVHEPEEAGHFRALGQMMAAQSSQSRLASEREASSS